MRSCGQGQVAFDYDLAVIGGGVGGLSVAMEAANLGKKVVVCNCVEPTPRGNTWGFGGTCLNVGCMPKKLMHVAAGLKVAFEDAPVFGWQGTKNPKHSWAQLMGNIQRYTETVRVNYEKKLTGKGVQYVEARACLLDDHKLLITKSNCQVDVATARYIVIATGSRPRYLGLPCEKNVCITSDDLFFLKEPPGDTVIVGASFVALECAGILAGLGFAVTVLVRDACLSGLDRQMAGLVATHLQKRGVKLVSKCEPVGFHKDPDGVVVYARQDGRPTDFRADTALLCVGRVANVDGLGLDDACVAVKDGRIVVDACDQTSASSVYALGDVAHGRPHLSGVAMKTGTLLGQRLFGAGAATVDLSYAPVTVYTPLQYSCVGMSEEAAVYSYGDEDVEVYHSFYKPMDHALQVRDLNSCYAKMVCVKSMDDRVVGLHITGVDAADVVQGFALAVKMGAKYSDFQTLVGAFPSSAEIFTKLRITKRSGLPVEKTDC